MKIQLHKRLKELREEKGFSQTDIAKYLEISRQAISNWENGKTTPDIDNIVLLSKLYGISVDEFLGVDEQNSNPHNGSKKNTTENIKEQNKSEENNLSNHVERNIFEILCLAVILILASQFPVIGIITTIVVFVWMKKTKREYKIIDLLCFICMVVGIYTTYIMIEHLLYDFGTAYIEKI